jgi:hypothetical protein
LGPSMLLVPFSACAYLGSYFRAAWTADCKSKKIKVEEHFTETRKFY